MESALTRDESLTHDQAKYVSDVVWTIGGLATPEEMFVIIGGYHEEKAPRVVGSLIRRHRVIVPFATDSRFIDKRADVFSSLNVISEEEEPYVDVPFGHS